MISLRLIGQPPAELAEALEAIEVRLLPGKPEGSWESVLVSLDDPLPTLEQLSSAHEGPIFVICPTERADGVAAAGGVPVTSLGQGADILALRLASGARIANRFGIGAAALEVVLARCGVGIVVADAEGRIRRHNDLARSMLGLRVEETHDVIGVSSLDFPTLTGDAHPLYHAATEGVEVTEAAFELTHGGTARVAAVPLLHAGERLGAVGFVRPTTPAAEAMLATGVHALKNPLSVVQGFVQMLGETLDDTLSEEAKHLLERIELNTARVWRRVDDLHRFIRLADVRLERERCPLASVIAAAQRASRARFPEIDALVVSEGLPEVWGDFGRLVDLFEALLDNACAYAGPAAPAHVRVDAVVEAGLCRVRVLDNGVGIPGAERARIFEPFFRLHRYDEVEGTGLGLSIAQRIAERHGGYIEVHAGDGGGSEFTVSLPAVG